MKTRVIVGIVLAALLVGVLCLGGWALTAAWTILAVLAVHEMGVVLRARGLKPWLFPAYLFAAAYAVCYGLFGNEDLLLPIWFLGTILVAAERMFSKTRSTEDCFAGLASFLYPLPFFAVLMLLGGAFGRAAGLTGLVMAFAGPLVGDTLAYFVGSAIGKHKLCPHISPKKTVEGSVASIVGGILGGGLAWLCQGFWGGTVPLTALLLLGAACGVLGQIGDLFASAIKRWAGVKDYGALFPGHGGVLDRVDSVLFCAPVIYGYFVLTMG